MAAAKPVDFADLMPKVATLLCGERNKQQSRGSRWRYGTHGSMEIDVVAGWFDDHESQAKGGVLDLIQHKLGGDRRGALAWLEEQGLKGPCEPSSDRASPIFYDYRDAAGNVAYRVERRGKGQVPPFLQHGPDGRGGFHAAKRCMDGVVRLPYRLPELLAADPDQIVFVCEGEKDVDNLMCRGNAVATTNSGGAGKFGTELVPYFAGRRVVVIPDNDQPGRAHAEDVAAKLRGVAAAVAIVPLPGPDKGDVSDWLANGGSAHQLINQYAEPALAKAAEPPETFPLIELKWWAGASPTPRSFELESAIPTGEVTLFTGPGGVGKSLLAQQFATCFAATMPCLGLQTAGGVALYITAEDDERELHWRQDHLCRSLRVPMASLDGKLFPVTLRGRMGNELVTFDREGRLHVTEAYAALKATIAATAATLVFLDNVAHLFAGNENDRQQVTAFANVLAGLCRDHGCTIVLVGHPNKAGDDYSGSTAWPNAVRSHITLKRPDDEGADPDARVLALGKANYAQMGVLATFRWHNFAFVRDEDLSPSVAREIAATVAATAANTRFLECLDKATEERRATSAARSASNYAPRVFAKMTIGKGLGEKAFEAAMERLLHLGMILGDQRVYQRENRSWATGLARAEGCTNPCTNPAQSGAQTPLKAAQSPSTDPHSTRGLYTTYISGADPEGPSAPERVESDLSATLERLYPTDPFAPGDGE